MIQAAGLTKRYGEHVILDGLQLSVEPGERVAILGLNGAGKTTLFRCLLGVAEFAGDLRVGGHPAGPHGREARRMIGYVPQQPPRFDLTLDGFVSLFVGLRGGSVDRTRTRLADFGLSPERHGGKSLRDLSGGMLQKAVLAVALAADAPVLLLDEPTANLDPGSRREFLEALGRVDSSTTLLFASHRLGDVEALAERLLVLHEGRFVYDGDLGGLWRLAAGSRLLVMVPAEHRESLARTLEARSGVRAVRADGPGIDLQVEAGLELDLLNEIRESGTPLLDFRTRPPALEEVMAKLTGESGTTNG